MAPKVAPKVTAPSHVHGLQADKDKTVPSAAALRVASLADAGAIAALYREARSRDFARSEIEDWLENGGALVMQAGGRLVSALLWRAGAEGWRLDRLATLPDYRGQGFGRWLMTRVEALAIRENVPRLTLELDAERGDLLGYYRRMGYQRMGHQEDGAQGDSLQEDESQKDGADASRVFLSKRLGGTWQTKGRE